MILPAYDRSYWFYVQGAQEWKFSNDNIGSHYNSGTLSVPSFQIEEEEGAMPICTLRFIDDLDLAAKPFRRGRSVQISWGMDLAATSVVQFQTSLKTDEYHGNFSRTMQGVVMAAPGAFMGGKHIRTIKIRLGLLQYTSKNATSFIGMNVGAAITQVAAMLATRSIINFSASSTLITQQAPLSMNNESPLQFLRRMAVKFNCKLAFQTTQTFEQVLIFIDWDKQDTLSYGENRGLVGRRHYFDYGNSQSNIVGDPDYDQGDGSGMGSIPVPFTDPQTGQMGLKFTAADQQSTTQYILNPEKIKAKLRESGSTQSELQLTTEIAQTDPKDFMDGENIAQKYAIYFDRHNFTTIPEQMGWQWNMEVVPNPVYQIGDSCWLGPTSETGQSVIPIDIKSLRQAGGKDALWRLAKQSWEHNEGGVKQKLSLKR